ncbi:MAG: hypothetical protein RLZZ416_552 [Candidatus Parcubacteria bacterium]|jgi:hypothetical protein
MPRVGDSAEARCGLIFLYPLLRKRFTSSAFVKFGLNKKIFERPIVYIPILTDPTAMNFPVSAESSDIITGKSRISRGIGGGYEFPAIKKDLISHCSDARFSYNFTGNFAHIPLIVDKMLITGALLVHNDVAELLAKDDGANLLAPHPGLRAVFS